MFWGTCECPKLNLQCTEQLEFDGRGNSLALVAMFVRYVNHPCI